MYMHCIEIAAYSKTIIIVHVLITYQFHLKNVCTNPRRASLEVEKFDFSLARCLLINPFVSLREAIVTCNCFQFNYCTEAKIPEISVWENFVRFNYRF